MNPTNIRLTFLLAYLLMVQARVWAQKPPANDNCNNASEIVIDGNGYALGKTISDKSQLGSASTSVLERFASAHSNVGLNQQSVWYYFYLPARRKVTITLAQKDSAIAQAGAGIAVYKTKKCYPTPNKLAGEFPVLSKFGSVSNTCVEGGYYLIQVVANEKANGEIWVELLMEQPENGLDYDSWVSPIEINLSNQAVSQTIETNCLSLDDGEQKITPDSFNKSFWCTVKTNDATNEIAWVLNLPTGVSHRTYYVAIYEGDITKGVAYLSKKVFSNQTQNQGHLLSCADIKPNITYSIQFSFHSKLNVVAPMQIYATYGDGSKSYNRNQIHKSNIFRFKGNALVVSMDFISCKSVITDNKCNGKTNYFIDSNFYGNGAGIDTFQYQFYSLVHLGKRAKFTAEPNAAFMYKATRVMIFKGDVRKNCNLKRVPNKETTTCRDTGWYTVLLVCEPHRTEGKLYSYNDALGKAVGVNLIVNANIEPGKATYNNPASPEERLMDSITLRLNTFEDSSGTSWKTYQIAGKTYRGCFNFHTFQVPETGHYTVNMVGTPDAVGYVFQGNSKDGLNTLKRIKKYEYDSLWTIRPSIIYKCTRFEPGVWYTIVTRYDYDTLCNTSKHHAYFVVTKNLDYGKNIYPGKAHVFNDGNALTTPEHGVKLYGPVESAVACKVIGSTEFARNCTPGFTDFQSYYYVFTISKLSTINITGVADSYIQLYPFDCRTDDSLLLNDKRNMVENCPGIANFCRLRPGTYSIVRIDETSTAYFKQESTTLTITISKVEDTKNKFANFAVDLGIFNKYRDTSIKIVAGCPTNNSIKSDTSTNLMYDVKEGQFWFSFLAAGVSEINMYVSQNPGEQMGVRSKLTVFKAPASKNLPFEVLKSRNMVDSLETRSLTNVGQTMLSNKYQYQLINNSCDTVRYYVILGTEKTADPYNYALSVRFSGKKLMKTPQKGDFCADAVDINCNSLGKFHGILLPNCHTIGEGFGEDGSNMDCLGEVDGIKSSWFRIRANPGETFNLSLSMANRTDADDSKVRFRLLYGDFDALTPLACVGNSMASFNLECMANADYYVQVISPENAQGIIQLEANLTKSKNNNCKPFDTDGVLANFTAIGGCHNQPLEIANLSTQGADVSYKWYLDGKLYTEQKVPDWKLVAHNKLDSHVISLVTYNSNKSKSDSAWRWVYILRDELKVKANNDTNFLCNSTLPLHAKANYKKVLYTWFPDGVGIANRYKSKTTLNQAITKVWVEASLRNCRAYDTVHIYPNRFLQIEHAYKSCGPVMLKGPYGADNYSWNTGDTSRNIRADSSGRYVLKVIDGDCKLETSVDVKVTPFPQPIIMTSGFCLGDLIWVKFDAIDSNNIEFEWQNGLTMRKMRLKQPGLYTVSAHYKNNPCFGYDSLFIEPKGQIYPQLHDTFLCEFAPFKLDAGNENRQHLWNTGDSTSTIYAKESGEYVVKMKSKFCTVFDTARVIFWDKPVFQFPDSNYICQDSHITVIGYPGDVYNLWSTGSSDKQITIQTEDTFWLRGSYKYCTTSDTFYTLLVGKKPGFLGNDTSVCQPFDIRLNAGSGGLYWWNAGYTTSQHLQVHEPGMYAVRVETKGCVFTDTIIINDTCNYDLYVPNAFSPGNDQTNEVFLPKGMQILDFDMKIYNRWGEKIYETEDLQAGWNGTFRNVPCEVGVYVYIISYKTYKGWHYKTGNITLIR
ncbi:T9SS type B sorting domain-containing protein [bacterium]|nr:T9SS type B sorting domain-containing protein [bacterium]